MQFATSLFLALIGIFYSAAAAPAPTCIVPQIYFTSLPKDFTISALVRGPSTSTTQASWPLQLSPRNPSKSVTSIPIISRTRIASPTFRLVNETLVTAEGGWPAILSPSIAIFPPPLQGFEFGGPGETPAKFGAIYACDTTGQQYVKLVADQGIISPLSSSFSSLICFFWPILFRFLVPPPSFFLSIFSVTPLRNPRDELHSVYSNRFHVQKPKSKNPKANNLQAPGFAVSSIAEGQQVFIKPAQFAGASPQCPFLHPYSTPFCADSIVARIQVKRWMCP
jgi:hypothetical protein